MDSADLSKAPREVTVAGGTYLVRPLELREWGALQAWLKDHAKDPVVAAMESLNRARAAGVEVHPDDRKGMLEAARVEAKAWPPRVGTGAWFDAVELTEGAAEAFLGAVLRVCQPGISREEIARVKAEATDEESNLLILRALGYVPAPKAGEGATAPSPPNTTPTTGDGSPAS